MVTASERLNQPVYFYGDRVGRICDYWLDSSLQHIVGVTVGRGWVGLGRRKWTIPYTAIFAWQARSLSMGNPEILDDTSQLVRFHLLRQQRVIVDGRPHGRISDILFGADGAVLGLSAARFGRFGSYIFTPESIEAMGSSKTPLVVNTSRHLLAI